MQTNLWEGLVDLLIPACVQGLLNINVWYGARYTHVFVLNTPLPVDAENTATYEKRGWCARAYSGTYIIADNIRTILRAMTIRLPRPELLQTILHNIRFPNGCVIAKIIVQ